MDTTSTTTAAKMTVEFRKEKEVPGLLVQGQKVIVRELSPLDFFNAWDQINQLGGDKSIFEEIKIFAGFATSIMPEVCNVKPDALLPFGFSVIRKVWDTFLEVNTDFLWMWESVGAKSVWTSILNGFRKEFNEKLLPYFLRSVLNEVYQRGEAGEAEESKPKTTSLEALPVSPQSGT